MIDLVEVLKLHAKYLRGDADGQSADLLGARLQSADLRGACMDFTSWPLCCGGTLAKLDRRLSLQLIYHMFNNSHSDVDITNAVECLRQLAQEFIDNHRIDATPLRS